MKMVYEAIKYADRRHKGQKRKATGWPYITHPIAVAFLLARYKVSKHMEELLVACIVHDVVEDSDATHAEISRRFGPLVASIVHELTNDPAEVRRVGKLAHQKTKVVGISSYGLVCKLVDRLHNITDHPTDKMVAETLELMSHLKKNRKLSKTQQRIVGDIEERCLALQG